MHNPCSNAQALQVQAETLFLMRKKSKNYFCTRPIFICKIHFFIPARLVFCSFYDKQKA